METSHNSREQHSGPVSLWGREAESERLDGLLSDLRAGLSGALVIRGDPGIGKSALLDYVLGRASGCRTAHIAGMQSEAELPFAGVHQLCGPLLDYIGRIPEPQQTAMLISFGRTTGPAPDRFLVSLAVLSLLSAAAEESPLLCVVDDFQWLDETSKSVLGFVARRLRNESLGLVLTSRVQIESLAGIPTMQLGGLAQRDALSLVNSVLGGSFDRQVKEQIVAESHGNPLALLEFSRRNTQADLAGGFRVPHGASLREGLEEGFRRRRDMLSDAGKLLLLLAAADPTGDADLVGRACEALEIDPGAREHVAESGLATFGERVQFQHPLARSAAYWAADPPTRRNIHRVLGDATSLETDPDRRTWHHAQAAAGKDERVADELERSADRAMRRGGFAAAGAFLARAAELTPDASQRGTRALAAAGAHMQAGMFDTALELIEAAESAPLAEHERARCDLIRGGIEFALSRGGEASALFMRGASRLDEIDPVLARDSYLNAFVSSMFAGRLAASGGGVRDVARAAIRVATPGASGTPDYLLKGLTLNFSEGYAAGAPSFHRALEHLGDATADELRWMWNITLAALHLWDDEHWVSTSKQYVDLARSMGALSEMPLALSTRAMALIFTGDTASAAALVEEQSVVSEATESQLAPYSAMLLAAISGDEKGATALISKTIREAPVRGEGTAVAVAEWANALLRNGLGEYATAMAAAERALHIQEYPEFSYPGIGNWAVTEYIEAAVRSGAYEAAETALAWIADMTDASGTAWARGLEKRSRALLLRGSAAEDAYRASLDLLGRSRASTDLARAHLVYGEWLRRERRRTDARAQLLQATRMFDDIGMDGFAARARRELHAAGLRPEARSKRAGSRLTAQEALIAGMAAEGLSNPEIAVRLFISPRTVQYHLGKVFLALGISSRSQIELALAAHS